MKKILRSFVFRPPGSPVDLTVLPSGAIYAMLKSGMRRLKGHHYDVAKTHASVRIAEMLAKNLAAAGVE